MSTPPQTMPQPLLVVTGLSGAGKTTALKALEDLGYDAVDNLPIALIPSLLAMIDDNPAHAQERPLAVGIDCRTRAFKSDTVAAQIGVLRQRTDLAVSLLFFDCDDAGLVQRFSQTRRRHPLAEDRPIADGIARERALLDPLRHIADALIDTSGQSVHDIKHQIQQRYCLETSQNLIVTLMSFGFARSVPRDADMVLDVRFLRNPHYNAVLKPLTGKDQSVADYIAADTRFEPFATRALDLLCFLLPHYRHEGKSYFTLGLGCTGGQHRSVFVTEWLAKALHSHSYDVTIVHRDCPD